MAKFLRLIGLSSFLLPFLLSPSHTALAKPIIQQQASVVCYTVADGYLRGGEAYHDDAAEDTLMVINFSLGDTYQVMNEQWLTIERELSNIPTVNVEAIALDPTGTILYGADGARLGWFNLTNGDFSPLSIEFGMGVGYLAGRLQSSRFDDVDSLSFDPTTGLLYGVDRNPDGLPDTLFQINPRSGHFVDDAFSVNGQQVDFVEVQPIAGLDDVDDIAIDPKTGELFAILNSQEEIGGRLATINKETGATSEIGPLHHSTTGEVPDMEGLTMAVIHGESVLYGSTGQYFNGQNLLWQIDPETASATVVSSFDKQFIDVESIACLQQTGTIEGVVWDDLNFNGLRDEREPGLADVAVELYTTDSDAPEMSTETDTSGSYRFIIGAKSYNIQYSRPDGYQFSPPNQGDDDEMDSDVDPLTGTAGPIDLISGSYLANWSAGLFCTLPQLEVQIVSEEISVMPGETIAYALEYENVGQGTALNVAITELVPEHTTFVPELSTPGWICLNSVGTDRTECLYEVGIVTAGEPDVTEAELESTEVIFTVRVDKPLPDSIETIDNQVSINYVSECGKVIDGQGTATMQASVVRPTSLDGVAEPMLGIQIYLPIAYD